MKRLHVQATKSNLLKYRKELEVAAMGHKLLEQKKDLLTRRLQELLDTLAELQADLYGRMKEAYALLETATITDGRLALHSLHDCPASTLRVEVEYRKYMGLSVPAFRITAVDPAPRYSPASVSYMVDVARMRFREIIEELVEYCEKEAQLFRLSWELKKTIRRVNALENIFIPQYRATVSYLEETLDELEREENFIRKKVGELMERNKMSMHRRGERQ